MHVRTSCPGPAHCVIFTCSCIMIRTQEVYTLLIMKLAEHIYKHILSKFCFSCVLPENKTCFQWMPLLLILKPLFTNTISLVFIYLGGVPLNVLQFHLPNVLDLIASKQWAPSFPHSPIWRQRWNKWQKVCSPSEIGCHDYFKWLCLLVKQATRFLFSLVRSVLFAILCLEVIPQSLPATEVKVKSEKKPTQQKKVCSITLLADNWLQFMACELHPVCKLWCCIYIQGTSNLKAPAKGSVASFFAKQGQ